MSLGQTQPKPGHLRGTSSNPTKKTGRSDGHERVEQYHKRGTSSNPVSKKRPEVGQPDNVNRMRKASGTPPALRNVSAPKLKKGKL